ncbi:DUF4838 domain-containing protein [PVC group bacterium]|nr:DUF4838 domain-containing protein [PVC group bacterium]
MDLAYSLTLVVAIATVQPAQGAPLRLSAEGAARAAILLATDATEVERTAAAELATFLKQITGAEFATRAVAAPGLATLAVGPSAATVVEADLDVSLGSLGHEGIVLRCDGRSLILTGAKGARRGTLYAVYTFLTDVTGCRWWAPGASTVPKERTLDVPETDRRESPVFEYRESYIAHTVDGEWAARNRVNGHFYRIPSRLGGHTAYRGYKGGWGFVHTFNTIVPPKEFYPKHPDWFSEINGKRIGPPERSQWCLANVELLEVVKTRVHEMLSASPPDSIVEVSQNDWRNRCQCAACAALEQEEGSPSGPLLRFVNAVAQHIEKDFPEAAISTLAYQYTRQPPKVTRPRPNVCIRLCSIECSFLQPLEHEANKAFADDIRRWSELTDRLYIWDYVTNFGLPLQPHPNLRVLAPNVRFFARHGAKGVFEEGGHYTRGAAFSDVRAWVLARLLWNPKLDGDALVREFVAGYYEDAAPYVQKYIDRLHDTAEESGCYMPCFDRKSPYLGVAFLNEAEQLFAQAEPDVAGKPQVLKRVELGHASVWHAIMSRWTWLKIRKMVQGTDDWFARSREEYCRDYVRVCREHRVNSKHIKPWEKMSRRRQADLPDLVKGLPRTRWLDLQDELFTLYKPGKWASYVDDASASDGMAARMPADHLQWAVQCTVPMEPDLAARKWAVYVAVRVERNEEEADGGAFQAGVYDTRARKGLGHLAVSLSDAAPSDQYRLYRIKNARLSPDAYIWVAPTKNPDLVKGIYVDRMLLVDEGP